MGRAHAVEADGPGILWVSRDDSSPHGYLVESARRAGAPVRDLRWAQAEEGKRPFGRIVTLGRPRAGREYSITLKVVSPRLLMRFVRAPEDVIVVYELGLPGLYAGLSKALRRRRRVVSLIEGDYQHLGRTGTAGFKLPVRRLAARLVDAFVANNALARDYLISTLHVPVGKIVDGWWLAGLPPELESRLPAGAPLVPEGTPLFVSAGRLESPKGVDLLIEAVAAYRTEFGACMVWVIGDGPEREALAELVHRLHLEDCVVFLGPVDHASLKGALQACQALVFPTLCDLIGRVVVEALSTGTPVVVSPMTGAAGTVVQDGVNGFVVDPHDARALAAAMYRTADPEMSRAIRDGISQMNPPLLPGAAAGAVLRAVERARAANRVRSDAEKSDSAPAARTRDRTRPALRVGDVVEVRSQEEILATLDENGELDGLPFMPEMLAWCGRQVRVDKLAHKLCDTIDWTGIYRMRDAVHLEASRCNGQAHGGCQAGCNLYWKTAWLKRIPLSGHEPERVSAPISTPACTRANLIAATRRITNPGADPEEERYKCQATELLRAAPERIPPWDLRQYVQDVRSGNTGTMATIWTLAVGAFNEYQDASCRLLPRWLRIRGGRRFPFIDGRLEKTPTQTLDLQPGERVRVRRKEDIVATLDVNNANRGMWFDGEMVRYCGHEASVLRRVERIIDEKSGRMLHFKNPCIVLDDVTCTSAYHRQCPRGIYAYWRELWLERAE